MSSLNLSNPFLIQNLRCHPWRWCHFTLCTPLHPDLCQLLVKNSPLTLYTVSANYFVLSDFGRVHFSQVGSCKNFQFRKLKKPKLLSQLLTGISISAQLCAGSISENTPMKSAPFLFTVTHRSSLALSNQLSRCFMRSAIFTTIMCMVVKPSQLSQTWFGHPVLRRQFAPGVCELTAVHIT